MVIKCLKCEKDFKTSNGKRKFCSVACFNNWQSKKIKIECAYCGKEFSKSPSALKYGRKYCSHTCEVQSRIKNYECQCLFCKKIFLTKRAKQKFCSSKCSVNYTKNLPTRIEALKKSHFGKYKHEFEENILKNLYIIKGLTIEQCAKKLGVSSGTVRIRLHRLDIQVRSLFETKLGSLNPRFGNPGTMLGKKMSESAKEKMRQHNFKYPRRFWLDKKRPEMSKVKGFGDHKGKTYEEIMGKEKGEKRKIKMSEFFKANPDIPRRGAMAMIKKLDNYKSNTKIERILKEKLIDSGFMENIDFIHQYNFLNKNKFVCDFSFPKYKLIVECDGDYWHANPLFYSKNNLTQVQKRNMGYDKSKNAYIKKCGWNILRIWEYDIEKNPEKIIKKITDVLYNKQKA